MLDLSGIKNDGERQHLSRRIEEAKNEARGKLLVALTSGNAKVSDVVLGIMQFAMNIGGRLRDFDNEIEIPASPIPLSSNAREDSETMHFELETTLLKSAIGGDLQTGRLGDVLEHCFLQAMAFGYAVECYVHGDRDLDKLLARLVETKDKLNGDDVNAFARRLMEVKPEQSIYYLRSALTKGDLDITRNEEIKQVIRRFKTIMI